MVCVCAYFQVHQPYRLRRYSVFNDDPFYFDDRANAEILRRVAEKCYRPATSLILDLVRRHRGRFRVSYSLSGVVMEQLSAWAPDVLGLFRELAQTGCVEFLGETHYHSLSSLASGREWAEQIDLHTEALREKLGVTPRVFRNTELVYSNQVAEALSRQTDASGRCRWLGCLAEGTDLHLGYRSPAFVYRPPPWEGRTLAGAGGRPLALLLKNYRLSDDIAFRFSNRAWAEWPLTAEKFARWVDQINGNGHLCNLFMDYETFGEHQWADSGIFDFLEHLPDEVLRSNPGHNSFVTCSEALERFEPVGDYDVHQFISWADTERDLSAWRGNAMQNAAMDELYRLEEPIKQRLAAARSLSRPEELEHALHLLNDWRKLTTSDHLYYMCTKHFSDGAVHKYFNPYDSPYDSYINFMNVLDNVRTRLARPPASA